MRRSVVFGKLDKYVRILCRRLTERQRMVILFVLYLPFLIGCIYVMGTSLHRFGKNSHHKIEIEHIHQPVIPEKSKIQKVINEDDYQKVLEDSFRQG